MQSSETQFSVLILLFLGKAARLTGKSFIFSYYNFKITFGAEEARPASENPGQNAPWNAPEARQDDSQARLAVWNG
jgi:hypothetical protein